MYFTIYDFINFISVEPFSEYILFMKTYLSGHGVKYLHREPASRRRRRKGSLKSETEKYGRESQGTRT
jgi:hypothetical protein